MFRISRDEVDFALTNTCRMALARLTISAAGYDIRTSGGIMVLSLSRRRLGFELAFSGAWKSRKGMLIRRLLAKQFEPVIPRPRIRLRSARQAISP